MLYDVQQGNEITPHVIQGFTIQGFTWQDEQKQTRGGQHDLTGEG